MVRAGGIEVLNLPETSGDDPRWSDTAV